MKTPITYYGGKQSLVSTIIPIIPAHRVYCEPYFGGGAVFFAKKKSYLEVINDIDDRIITFYEVCQDEALFEKLQKKIKNTLDAERVFLKAHKIWCQGGKNTNKIDVAWAVWLLCNMGFSGSPEGGWKWDNGTSGSHAGIVMDNYRNRFTYKVHERMKHVQISCRDALKVIRQRDTENTFFFLDPPYPGSNQKHYSGFNFDDLKQLLEILTTVKGKFLLCNFSSPMLDNYIERMGWLTIVKDMPLIVANRIKGRVKRKQEVMVLNYKPIPTLF